jgi:alkylation response protein AidB-like acyl-CoA dehydrogenase
MAEPWDVVARLRPKFTARAEDCDRTGAFPAADFADLRAAGLFGLFTSRAPRRDGSRLRRLRPGRVRARARQRRHALVFNMHASVTGALAGVPDELARSMGVPESFFDSRDRVLAAAAEGAFYAVAMSERGVGSRLSQLATRYEAVDGGFHIKGSKSFVSGAGHADAYLVAARSAADDSVVSQFLIPAGTAGMVVEETWDSLGMRATSSHDLHLDVVVPADDPARRAEGWRCWWPRSCHIGWSPATPRSTWAWRRPRSTNAWPTARRAESPTCRMCGPGSGGRTRRWRRPGWWSTRRPGG